MCNPFWAEGRTRSSPRSGNSGSGDGVSVDDAGRHRRLEDSGSSEAPQLTAGQKRRNPSTSLENHSHGVRQVFLQVRGIPRRFPATRRTTFRRRGRGPTRWSVRGRDPSRLVSAAAHLRAESLFAGINTFAENAAVVENELLDIDSLENPELLGLCRVPSNWMTTASNSRTLASPSAAAPANRTTTQMRPDDRPARAEPRCCRQRHSRP